MTIIYPPHKTPSVVEQYEPIIKKAIAAHPNPVHAKPERVSSSTFIARLRDSIKALGEYHYPHTTLTPEELGFLETTKLVVSQNAATNSIVIGTQDSIRRLRNQRPAGQIAAVDSTNLTAEVDAPTELVLKAMAILVQAQIAETFSISGLSLEQVQTITQPYNIDVYELDNRIILC
jgi:hypothetical protein